MTNSRLIQCHARVLPNPDQNGKSTPDRSKLFGSHGQRPWFQQVMNRRSRKDGNWGGTSLSSELPVGRLYRDSPQFKIAF